MFLRNFIPLVLLGSSSVAWGQQMHEASTSFDFEMVSPFLLRLNEKLGLDLDVERLVEFTANVSVEQERGLTLSAVFQGTDVEFEYRVYMDDIEAPDIYILSQSQDFADTVSAQIEAYFEEEGL